MDECLEKIKVEAALRSENMKMQFRKVNKPNEINILDYTVIAALEKQIPKKITHDGFCPICNTQYPMYPPSLNKYCGNCGQKLDWD